jgi:adenylosuccinate lyase
MAEKIKEYAKTPIMGYTHLQPAEPTTLGYRLAQPAQDLMNFHHELDRFQKKIRAKGFTGAVGTSASFASLIGEENLPAFQDKIAKRLDLEFYPVVNQTYPRLQDYQLLSLLAGQGAAVYKLAFDLRVLQSPPFGELAEPFGNQQVGSSAMPFKQNPIRAEKVNSLGRLLAQFPRTAWDNAAHSLLERTLDDSANMRVIIPEAFLCLDEMLKVVFEIISGLKIHQEIIQRNLAEYAPFAATENLLMQLSKNGADRQLMHEVLRGLARQAWSDVQTGKPNPLIDLVLKEGKFLEYLPESDLRQALLVDSYLGDAPLRAAGFADEILRYFK